MVDTNTNSYCTLEIATGNFNATSGSHWADQGGALAPASLAGPPLDMSPFVGTVEPPLLINQTLNYPDLNMMIKEQPPICYVMATPLYSILCYYIHYLLIWTNNGV